MKRPKSDIFLASAKSRNLTPAANEVTERSNHHRALINNEKEIILKPYDGRIVSEANAQSNVWDTQTETR